MKTKENMKESTEEKISISRNSERLQIIYCRELRGIIAFFLFSSFINPSFLLLSKNEGEEKDGKWKR
jgi:hypothetical protein